MIYINEVDDYPEYGDCRKCDAELTVKNDHLQCTNNECDYNISLYEEER